MAKVYVFLADGFEDIEALAPVDILRRGGIEVVTVSIMESDVVISSHGVSVLADALFDDVPDFADADVLMLPGGMPGAAHLDNHSGLHRALLTHHERGGRLAAICAAPMVLGHLGLLRGVKATCYPSFEQHLTDAHYTADIVTEDGLFTTGRGPAAAMAFGYALLAHFVPTAQVEALREGMIYNQLLKG